MMCQHVGWLMLGGTKMSEMVTSEELQQIYKISRSTIDRWRKDGMPFEKIGRGVRFDLDQVKDWIKKNKQDV